MHQNAGRNIQHILITGLDACHVFEWKGNLTDSTVWNTGETGDIHLMAFFFVMNYIKIKIIPSQTVTFHSTSNNALLGGG